MGHGLDMIELIMIRDDVDKIASTVWRLSDTHKHVFVSGRIGPFDVPAVRVLPPKVTDCRYTARRARNLLSLSRLSGRCGGYPTRTSTC